MRALRFDDSDTREDRKKLDKLAPIREMFDGFIDWSKNYYNLSSNVTIDEMLESFRGPCSFRQYMPNKPAKYRIKVHALVDSKTYYVYNMEIYAGQQPEGPYKVDNSASAVIKRLIAPISKSGRNITCDNWYTSFPLANNLQKIHNLTMVGTVRKNKREIPPLFTQKLKERPIN